MIQPTVGRVVLYHPGESDPEVIRFEKNPVPAIVTHVWHERMVNLVVFDANGASRGRTSVELHQPEDTPVLHGGFWCEWMPYQVKKPTGSESGEKAAGAQVI